MTFHKVRAKNAKGHRPNRAIGQKCSPRLATSFDPLVWKAIQFLSKKRNLPVAQIVRDGMLSYTTPLLYDLAAGREPNFKANVK